MEKKEKAAEAAAPADKTADGTVVKTPFSRKLKWLCYMLFGGPALPAFEHIWHGEVVPWFPSVW